MSYPSAPITVVGGKGGVGKTTIAAAHALRLADAGYRTLLLSTDPAHSLSDALAEPAGDHPIEVVERLWVREPDADAAVQRRIEEVTEDAYRAVPREIMPAVRRHLEHAAGSPGMIDSALADQLIGAISEVPRTWDHLVVDSAPTGQLLRMLNLPTLLTPWIQGLARQRERAVRADRFAASVIGSVREEDDPLLERLHARRQRLDETSHRLRDDCQVRLVLLPRRMVLSESARASQALIDAGITLGTAVLNQIPPEPDPDAVTAARQLFTTSGLVEVPRLEREPVGIEELRALASLLD